MKCLLSLLFLLPSARAAETWLCVGSPPFLDAARPLLELRREQGLNVQTSSAPVPEAVKNCPQPPDYILLLGDEVLRSEPADAAWHLPAGRRPFHGWKDSHPKQFVSDMAYGDFDSDGMPDASVGRLPARRTEDVAAGVAKILRWEKHTPSPADLSIPVWAGDPGFTPLFRDMALDFLFGQIRARSPLWAELWIMQGDVRSPFCGWPVNQPREFNGRLTGGSLVSAMIGHGSRSSWWSMDLRDTRLHYTAEDAAALKSSQPAAPHIIFACECGSFAMRERDGLAEAMFHAPGGPVLCVGAAEDSHPLTNYYHSTAVLSALSGKAARFGTLWLQSLRAASKAHEPDKEALVRMLEPLIIGKSMRTEDLRADHQLLYNIIGDPATRLFSPAPLEAVISETKTGWEWQVPHPPEGARLLVQVRPPLPEFKLAAPAASEQEAQVRHAKANEALAFRTLQELAAGQLWKGTASGPGTLRLVALSPGAISVSAAAMKTPAAP